MAQLKFIHKILCVDDNENNLFSLEVLLSEINNCRVLKAQSGHAALDILIAVDIDIILLDVQMPEMDGFELAELLKSNKRTKDIPIIFLTAVFKSDEFIKKGYRTGAVDYLTKPVNDDQLLNKISLYLKLCDREKELRDLNNSLIERVQEELRLNRQKDFMMIQQSRLASMGELIMQIAHHWRQPINIIGLLIQDLLDAYDSGELTREYLAVNIEKSMRTLTEMSDTIDEFRRYTKSSLTNEPFDLREIVEKTVALIEPIFKYDGISIESEYPAENIIISGFVGQYSQVLINLLNNAKDAIIEHKPENPLIRVQLYKDGENSVLSVADNGGGIAPGIIERICEPYFTSKEGSNGTGLGLFVAKNFIEKNMHGKLLYQNIEGGAEFKIVI
ncbi:MAG: hybrid sensor histidine kinase/response regulator [Nitrospirae bacterium YQR-1]